MYTDSLLSKKTKCLHFSGVDFEVKKNQTLNSVLY